VFILQELGQRSHYARIHASVVIELTDNQKH